MKKHKHCEVIKAWADGNEIQYRLDGLDKWYNISQPSFSTDFQYRVKPKYIVKELDVYLTYSNTVDYIENGYNKPNLSLTFDAETKELKGVELL